MSSPTPFTEPDFRLWLLAAIATAGLILPKIERVTGMIGKIVGYIHGMIHPSASSSPVPKNEAAASEAIAGASEHIAQATSLLIRPLIDRLETVESRLEILEDREDKWWEWSECLLATLSGAIAKLPSADVLPFEKEKEEARTNRPPRSRHVTRSDPSK